LTFHTTEKERLSGRGRQGPLCVEREHLSPQREGKIPRAGRIVFFSVQGERGKKLGEKVAKTKGARDPFCSSEKKGVPLLLFQEKIGEEKVPHGH